MTKCLPVFVCVQSDIFDSCKPAEDPSVFVEIIDHCLPYIQIVGVSCCLEQEMRQMRERGRERKTISMWEMSLRENHLIEEVGALNEFRSQWMLTPVNLEVQGEGLRVVVVMEVG